MPAAEKVPESAAKAEKATEKTAVKASRHYPFHGSVEAIDGAAKTFKVGERTFSFGAEARVMKSGQPSSFGEIKAGDAVSGAYLVGEDGKLEIMSLRIGPKPGKEGKMKKEERK